MDALVYFKTQHVPAQIKRIRPIMVLDICSRMEMKIEEVWRTSSHKFVCIVVGGRGFAKSILPSNIKSTSLDVCSYRSDRLVGAGLVQE